MPANNKHAKDQRETQYKWQTWKGEQKTMNAFSFLPNKKHPNQKSSKSSGDYIFDLYLLLIFLSDWLICKISNSIFQNEMSALCTNICKKAVGIELCLFLKFNDNWGHSQYGTVLYLMGFLFGNVKFMVLRVRVVYSNATTFFLQFTTKSH